jgi:hypothetical protein
MTIAEMTDFQGTFPQVSKIRRSWRLAPTNTIEKGDYYWDPLHETCFFVPSFWIGDSAGTHTFDIYTYRT